MFKTISQDQLANITGGAGSGAAYNFGYGAGGLVTKAYEALPSGARMVNDPSNSSRMIPKADIPVVGPLLTRIGFPNVGAGATDVVNDRANLHAIPR